MKVLLSNVAENVRGQYDGAALSHDATFYLIGYRALELSNIGLFFGKLNELCPGLILTHLDQCGDGQVHVRFMSRFAVDLPTEFDVEIPGEKESWNPKPL